MKEIKINPVNDEIVLIVDTQGRATRTKTYIRFRDSIMRVSDGAYTRTLEKPDEDELKQ